MIMNALNQKDIKTLINEGNFNEVVNKYKKIIEIEPNNYKAHNNYNSGIRAARPRRRCLENPVKLCTGLLVSQATRNWEWLVLE